MTLDIQREGGVSTKGPRGGVFVMYNCARLHTLFDSYERGVEKGESPEPEAENNRLSTKKNVAINTSEIYQTFSQRFFLTFV